MISIEKAVINNILGHLDDVLGGEIDRIESKPILHLGRDEVPKRDSVPMINQLFQREIDQQVQVLDPLAVGLEIYFPKPVCHQVT